MNDDRKKRQAAFFRVKQSLVDDLMSQSDEQILAQAEQDGINADEVRSRVLHGFEKAKLTVNADRIGSTDHGIGVGPRKKPTVLSIDAAQARAILKRVASRTHSDAVPLPIAAQLGQVKGDEEALRIVSDLKDAGVISDDELK